MGHEVRQKSKSALFCATDLVNISNKKRAEIGKPRFNFSAYLNSKATKEFVEELQKENKIVISKGNSRNRPTWVHPLLFIDIALSINPKFKIEVYKWIYDELLKYRNNSGESYKKMVGALYELYPVNIFHRKVTSIANYIKKSCEVTDWNEASEKQLILRDKMHDNIYLLCSVLKKPDVAVKLGVYNALKN